MKSILESENNVPKQMELADLQAHMTVAQAILPANPQLSSLALQDKKVLLKAVSLLISQLCQEINVGKSMNTLQIYSAALLLAETFWFMRLEEFVYVFKQAKLGKYGKTYDRIDVQIIAQWFHTYDSQERNDALEKQRLEQQAPEQIPPEVIQQAYEKINKGEKLTWQIQAEEKKKQTLQAEQKEVAYRKFRKEYFEKHPLDPDGDFSAE